MLISLICSVLIIYITYINEDINVLTFEFWLIMFLLVIGIFSFIKTMDKKGWL